MTDQPLEPLERNGAKAVAEDESIDQGSDPTGLTPEPTPEPLARVTAERDEYLDLLQRTKADFENYRKRAAREQERLVAHAHERLVKELLPVLDDLERAAQPPVRESGPKEGVRGNRVEVPPTKRDTPGLGPEYEALLQGVKLVENALRKALEKEGLAEIPTDGPFDPHVHEALLTKPDDGAESGSVLEVVQRGYRLGDRVVRPARVIVAE